MLKKFLPFALLSIMVTSCQYPIHNGTFISDQQLSEIENRKLSKEELEQKLGVPNVIPTYSKDTWYYIHRDMSRRAFFDPKIQSQRIVKITFNTADLVDSVEVINNTHHEGVNVVKEYTKTHGTELNPFQEYIKNFGRFNKSRKPDSRR